MADISLADFSHKQALTELWIEAFGDDEKFITSFLDAYMIPEYNVPVVISGGKIASALYLIEFELYSKTKIMGHCAYLFAAATKEKYRNKGYMSQLVSYSAELCKNRGLKAIFLFPQDQEQKLFDFYLKFGFKSVYGAEKITRESPADCGRPPLLRKEALTDKDITDAEIFDGLYNSYAEFTANQELAPMKDRLFYFRCASSYLDVHEKSEIKPHFAVFERFHEHNVEKFCYVFYKKYKNTYYIDDIILSGDNNIKCPAELKLGEIADNLIDFILNSGNDITIEATVPAASGSRAVPLAMILPLADDIRNITDNLEVPVYINMFMN